MGKGWAVGGAVCLALSVAFVARPGIAAGNILEWIHLAALVASYACWAYALAVGAYGDKGALLALVAYEVAIPVSLAAPLLRRAWPTGVFVLLALATAIVTLREVRERRGPARWGTAVALAAPLILIVPLAFL